MQRVHLVVDGGAGPQQTAGPSGSNEPAIHQRSAAAQLLAPANGLTFDAITRGQLPDSEELGAALDNYVLGALSS